MMISKLKAILLSIQLFSALIIQTPLRPYQVEPANAVIDSCLHNKGLEFLWIFPRQSGKDETIAQLEVFLLTLFQRCDANIVHVYPTQQQITTGLTRLIRRLDNPMTAHHYRQHHQPTRVTLGRAACTFFSGHPQARAEGATANLLLIINETQDQDETIIERRFIPMRASTNATALFVGTVRTTTDYLWRTRQRLEQLTTHDGIQRVYAITPDHVGRDNPHYAAFVQSQIQLKGRHHPSIKTELFCEPLDTNAGLFPPRRIALMTGSHQRQRSPLPLQGEGPGAGVYIATLDVAGQDEAATEGIFTTLQNPTRDYTVCTIFEATPGDLGPTYKAVDLFIDQGSRHFQTTPGQPPLFERLLAYLNHWQPIALIADASGVGQGITDALIKAWPRQIIPFDFAKCHNKAQLGNNFIALIETGRFKYWNPELPLSTEWRGGRGGEVHQTDGPDLDAWHFFEQCRFCAYELAAGLPIERGLKWGVSPHATTTTPDGHTIHVHDDRLLSAALIAEADRLHREGKLFLGTTQSAVIKRSLQGGNWS